MPSAVRLSARRCNCRRDDDGTLGAKIEIRRRELGLTRVEAVRELGCDAKTLMWWERNELPPYVCAYPAIIAFIGREPWDEPTTLADALLAFRRRRGLEIRKAAALIGVDEGTWGRWERREWKPMQRSSRMLDQVLGVSVAVRFSFCTDPNGRS